MGGGGGGDQMAVARALGEERLSPWHNLIPDTSVFAALMHCTYARDGKAVSLLKYVPLSL